MPPPKKSATATICRSKSRTHSGKTCWTPAKTYRRTENKTTACWWRRAPQLDRTPCIQIDENDSRTHVRQEIRHARLTDVVRTHIEEHVYQHSRTFAPGMLPRVGAGVECLRPVGFQRFHTKSHVFGKFFAYHFESVWLICNCFSRRHDYGFNAKRSHFKRERFDRNRSYNLTPNQWRPNQDWSNLHILIVGEFARFVWVWGEIMI